MASSGREGYLGRCAVYAQVRPPGEVSPPSWVLGGLSVRVGRVLCMWGQGPQDPGLLPRPSCWVEGAMGGSSGPLLGSRLPLEGWAMWA